MTQPLPDTRLRAILAFLQDAERLKDTLRSGRTSQGRPESVAEHSWRLALLVCLFEDDLGEIDMLRLLKLCLIHDLGEAISGDVPATQQTPDDDRQARERRDMDQLCAGLPDDMQRAMMALWDEYAAAQTPEAVMAKGFDKIETMLQHVLGRNDPDFDYGFNLTYGTSQTARHPLLSQIRAVVDEATRERADRP